jgi:hypothetical protein
MHPQTGKTIRNPDAINPGEFSQVRAFTPGNLGCCFVDVLKVKYE